MVTDTQKRPCGDRGREESDAGTRQGAREVVSRRVLPCTQGPTLWKKVFLPSWQEGVSEGEGPLSHRVTVTSA